MMLFNNLFERRILKKFPWEKRVSLIVLVYISTLTALNASAAIQDAFVTDVSDRAFSVVWASTESVVDASVRLYLDENGDNEVENTDQILVSGEVNNAHINGLRKIAITGLNSDTNYYIKLETNTVSGPEIYPEEGLIEVITALPFNIAEGNSPIANPIVQYSVQDLSENALPGSMVLIEVQGASLSPLSAFVTENGRAYIDLNNLFDLGGSRFNVIDSDVLELTEMRGSVVCPNFVSHTLQRFRLPPVTENMSLPFIQLGSLSQCQQYDINCDGLVDFVDMALVSELDGADSTLCAFNPDGDVLKDGIIDVFDVNAIDDFIQAQ